MDDREARGQRWIESRGRRRGTAWLAAGCLAVLLVGGQAARAQCQVGDIAHTLRFKVQVTTKLDRFVIWNLAPEMFMRVYIDGTLVETIDGQNGDAFEAEMEFNISPPYDPIEIELELMDEDPPLDDYTVDIVPGPNKTLKFTYDPLCQLISEVIPGDIFDCPVGNKNVECRGLKKTEGSEAWMQFSVGPSNGLPLVPNSLSIFDMQVIQVTPNASKVVADRPTVVRLRVASSHEEDLVAAVTVTAVDKAGTSFTDTRMIPVDDCDNTLPVVFFGPDWDVPAGFSPMDGDGNEFLVTAEIDPAPDCVDPPCQLDDCRVIDGKERENELELVHTRPLRVQYQPFARARSFWCHDEYDFSLPPIADAAAEPILRDLFPIVDYDGRSGSVPVWWPLPGGDPISDFVDWIDPRPGLMYLETSAAILGLDRLVLTLHDSNTGDDRGLQCHWTSMDATNAPGASAGDLSRVVLVEPEDNGTPQGARIVHEIAHTFGPSEAACPIDERAFGGIACEDEYNFPDGRVASFGVRVRNWIDPADDRDMDGTRCVMGSTSATTPSWIDNLDYEALLTELSESRSPQPSLQLIVQLRPGWLGSFLDDATSRLASAVPSWSFDASVDRNPDAFTTTLRMLRDDGSQIGTFSFTRETVDLDGDGWVEAFADTHSDETRMTTEPLLGYNLAMTLPLPADADRIELIRRGPDPGGGTAPIVSVVDVLELASPTVAVELLAPRSSFMASVGESYELRWRTLPGFRAPAGTTVPARSFIFLSPDEGATWFPLAAMLKGTSFTFVAPETRRYQFRVFATTGFETSDVQGDKDSDQDGCGSLTDPQPEVADPDGADADGVAQVCDLCPDTYDPLQADDDHDLLGDACDNCALEFNPQQANLDQDPLGDVCDCAPQDPTTWVAPEFVSGLRLSTSALSGDHTELVWQSAGAAAGTSTVYDAVSGDLRELKGPGRFLDATCVAVDAADGGITVYRPAPARGEGHWYLIRPDNPCGDGSYDAESPGQAAPRDDLLDQSQAPCA